MAALEALQKCMGAESLKLKRQCNALCVSLHKLPLDILAMIFLLDIRDRWENQDSLRRRRLELSRVCFHWTQIFHTFPSLWSHISHEQGDLTLALQRSRACPLHIACRPVRSSHIALGSPSIEGFLRLVSDHSDRWCAVWLAAYEEVRSVGRCLELPTSALRDISVVFGSNTYAHRNINLNPVGSTLRHINLERTRLPWDSCRLRGLCSLELRHLEGGLPTLHVLRLILLESPLLRRLALRDLLGDVLQSGDPPADYGPIHLPSLESLLIGNLPNALTAFIIQAVRPRRLSSLVLLKPDLSYWDDDGLPTPVFDLACPVLQVQDFLEITQDPEGKVTISAGVLRDKWKAWPYEVEETVIRIEFQHKVASTALMMAASLLHASTTSASIILETMYAPSLRTIPEIDPFPIAFLARLPYIHEIGVHDLQYAKAIVSHLAVAQKDDEGNIFFPNPCVVSLCLDKVKGLAIEDVEGLADRREAHWLSLNLPSYLDGR